MDCWAIWAVSATDHKLVQDFSGNGKTKKDLLCIGNEDETRVSTLSVSALRMCSIC